MKGEIYTQLKGRLQYRNEKLRRGEVRNERRSRRLRIFRERVPERERERRRLRRRESDERAHYAGEASG